MYCRWRPFCYVRDCCSCRYGRSSNPETPFAERMEAVPEDLDEFLKLASTDINTADKEALMELPGIGEVLSDRILKYRAQHGPFADWSEFLQIQGIGEHLVETLRPVAYLG